MKIERFTPEDAGLIAAMHKELFDHGDSIMMLNCPKCKARVFIECIAMDCDFRVDLLNNCSHKLDESKRVWK